MPKHLKAWTQFWGQDYMAKKSLTQEVAELKEQVATLKAQVDTLIAQGRVTVITAPQPTPYIPPSPLPYTSPNTTGWPTSPYIAYSGTSVPGPEVQSVWYNSTNREVSQQHVQNIQ